MIIRAARFHRSPERWLAILPCLVFVFAGATPANAVENIRRVSWDRTDKIAWSPETSTATLNFDGTLTPLEVAYAVTSFSVAVQYPVGSPMTLARYSCGPLPGGLQAGTSARISVDVSMSCDPFTGKIEIRPGDATMSYLHPSRGMLSNNLRTDVVRSNTFARGTFGLAVADMNGEYSPMSLPSNTFACLTAPEHGSIGVYFDPEGTICSGTIPAGTTGKVYIVAKTMGGTAGGIAGAEFRFTGVPEAWEVFAVPNENIVALGNPFNDGVVAGFVCLPPVAGSVVLYTVAVVAHADVSDVRFEIGPRVPPLSHPCPLLLACDDPVFTKFCVEGLACFVNATSPTPCATLPVEQTTWSVVKKLYR